MEFKRDPEFLKKRAQAMKEKKDETFSGRDFIFKEKLPLFQPHDGANAIRLLPGFWPEAMFAWVEVWIHYQIGPNSGQFLCPAKMLKKPCPVCEEGKKASDAGKSKEEIYSFNPQHRAIAWLVDRAEEGKGPQVWIMPYAKIAKEILVRSFHPRTGEPIFVDDPDKGRDIYFTKTGKQLLTQYTGVSKDDEATSLSEDANAANKWLKVASEKSLPDQLLYRDYAYIKEALFGMAPANTEEGTITSSQTKAKEEKSAPKLTIVPDEPKEAPAPTAEGLTLGSLQAMNREEVESLIDERSLDINVDEYKDDQELKDAVALYLDLKG